MIFVEIFFILACSIVSSSPRIVKPAPDQRIEKYGDFEYNYQHDAFENDDYSPIFLSMEPNEWISSVYTNPSIVTTYDYMKVFDLISYDGYIFASDPDNGYLRVFRVTDGAPVKNIQLTRPMGLLLDGSTLYVCDDGFGVRIFNIDDPIDPVQISEYPEATNCHGITKRDDTLFVGNQRFSAKIVDISDPKNPKTISSIDTGDSQTHNVVAFEDFAYISITNGFIIANLTDINNPFVVYTKSLSGVSYKLGVRKYDDGSTILFIGSTLKLLVYNVTNALDPQQINSETLYSHSTYLEGDLAFLASHHGAQMSGLTIVNISNPMDLTVVSTTHVKTIYYASYVEKKPGKDFAYVALGRDGYIGVNFTNITHPTVVSQASSFIGGRARRIDVMNTHKYAFIADSKDGWKILNLREAGREGHPPPPRFEGE